MQYKNLIKQKMFEKSEHMQIFFVTIVHVFFSLIRMFDIL